ncbi:DNA-binding MarR family transcriptional regulator [Prauserella shujinwangii]|uniref:DNA-binding MarR family transcriptional regulator n=1 Tax=Prauserella shujinwangii TaxID=1453103 RepID=A0A2T0M2J6_9PSEU|nr:MarR family winged helix-turn-helix transcriptional regulator [Prauserella shujinwangii]PRX50946.1 DNA-binding MarR family transcriptional regulator [Prauserella shujinwangii]
MGTSGLSELSEHQAAVWARYQRMRVLLAGRLGRELAARTGLSEADFEILTALAESPDGDGVRALTLRCGLEWEKSRLSHQLRRMEQRGLVVRCECAEDNRGAVVRITEHGRELAAEAKRCHDEAVRRYVADALTAEQLDALGEIADAVLRRLPR